MLDKELAGQALLQEHSILCGEIHRIQQTQRRLILSSVLSSGAILPFAAIYIPAYSDGTKTLSDTLVIAIGMLLSFLLLMMLCFYIGQYAFIFRITSYIRTHIVPMINDIAGTTSNGQRILYWEDYLATQFRPSRFAWAQYLLIAIAEAVSLLTLCVVYNLLWMYAHITLLEQPLTLAHWLYIAIQLFILGFIAFITPITIKNAKGELA